MDDLFTNRLKVISIGVEVFADALEKQNVETTRVDWRPPAGGDRRLVKALKRIKEISEKANSTVLERMTQADPVWIGIKPAIDVVPGMKKNMILHSGPDIEWDRMCTPQKNGIIGGIFHERLAETKEDAITLINEGRIETGCANDFKSVGAGVGIITASMMINVVRDKTTGTEGYCCPFEGRIGLTNWGVYNAEIENRLQMIEKISGPAINRVLTSCGGIELKGMIAQGIQMNDESHTRQVASGLILFSEIIPHLIQANLNRGELSECVSFLRTDRFFHSLGMASAIVILNDIKGVEYSTIVTTMAGNGVDFGIKVAALGDEWFTAPGPLIQGNYLSTKWGPQDALPYLGDSCIIETVGLGGFAAAASPSVLKLRGGSVDDAIQQTEQMRSICVGTNSSFPIPILEFAGPPIGIDIQKVVETGITPICHGGIISKEGGQIGAGSARIPIECFKKAIVAFGQKYSLQGG